LSSSTFSHKPQISTLLLAANRVKSSLFFSDLPAEGYILTRSSLFSILLLTSITLVGWRTYSLWKAGPWDLPSLGKVKPIFAADEIQAETKPAPAVGTESIVSKNLFDPERGAGTTRETEANSRSFQRVRNLVLLGTAILENNRYAVLREQASAGVSGQAVAGQSQNPMRLKLGDDFDGFKLTEIGDNRVVFTKGASRVEVLLDYFRKADPPAQRAPVPSQPRRVEGGVRPPVPGAVPGQVPAPGQGTPASPAPAPGQVAPTTPVAPRVIPNLPRRERVPIPPRNESEG
jgi:hypothetical protein